VDDNAAAVTLRCRRNISSHVNLLRMTVDDDDGGGGGGGGLRRLLRGGERCDEGVCCLLSLSG